MTVIHKAKQLEKEHGKIGAISILNNEIDEIKKDIKSHKIDQFGGICKISGLETAIAYLNGEI